MLPVAAESIIAPPPVSAAAGISLRSIRAGAIGVSIVAHLLAVAAIVMTPPPAPQEPEPLMRLVFAEPPPPPAPVAARAEPVVPVVEKTRKVVPKKPRPVPVVKPVEPLQIEAPPVVEAPPVESTGVAGGVSGGVTGGTVGGVVGGRGDSPVPVGMVARPPMVVKRVMPVYPATARRRGVEGLVKLEAVLDAKGRVEESVRILQSIAELDEAAIAALRKWRFAPARDAEGREVRVILEVPIRFVLR